MEPNEILIILSASNSGVPEYCLGVVRSDDLTVRTTEGRA